MLKFKRKSRRQRVNVSDQVSHPYKTTSKIIVGYILIFKFLDSKLEDKRFCKLLISTSSNFASFKFSTWNRIPRVPCSLNTLFLTFPIKFIVYLLYLCNHFACVSPSSFSIPFPHLPSLFVRSFMTISGIQILQL